MKMEAGVSVLSCTEYPNAVLTHLYALYKSNTLCDVTLLADDDGTSFRVHSVLLMSSSSYFRTMTNIHNHYTIKNVDGGCLGALVEFLYTGSLQLSSYTAPTLYTTACHLQIQHAVDLCQVYLLGNLTPAPAPVPTPLPAPASVSTPIQAQQQVSLPSKHLGQNSEAPNALESNSLESDSLDSNSPALNSIASKPNVQTAIPVPSSSIQTMEPIASKPMQAESMKPNPLASKPLTLKSMSRNIPQIRQAGTVQSIASRPKPANSVQVQRFLLTRPPVHTSLTLKGIPPDAIPPVVLKTASEDKVTQSPTRLIVQQLASGVSTQKLMNQEMAGQLLVQQPTEVNQVERVFKQEPMEGEEDTEDNTMTEEDLTSPLSIVLHHAKQLDSTSTTTAPVQNSSSVLAKPPELTSQQIVNAEIKAEKRPMVQYTVQNATTQEVTQKFKCQICSKRFSSELKVMYHRHQHFQENRIANLSRRKRIIRTLILKRNLVVYGSKLNEKTGKTTGKHRCKLCGKDFTMRSLYTKHLNQSHIQVVNCPSCLKPFPRTSLPLHIALKHPVDIPTNPAERPRCRICQQVFIHASSLRNHRHDRPTTENVHRCVEDGCTFQTRGALLRLEEHVEEEHPEAEYECPQKGCPFSSPLQLIVQRHEEKVHGGLKRCDACDKRFRHTAAFNTHMFTKHRVVMPGVQVLDCPVEGCDYQCTLSSLMEQHSRKHQASKQLECPECGRKLKTEKNLEKHLNKVHRGIRPYICHLCGLTYGEEAELKTHMARHGDTKPYQCHLCAYGTFDKATYQAHMYSRHGVAMRDVRVLSCDRCPFTTCVRSRLDDHQRVHRGQRDILCPHCSKAFLTKKTLRGHIMKVHGPKRHICAACGYSVCTASKLREHVRVRHTHRNLRPFQCPYCSFTSATAANCRKHVQHRHKGQEVRYIKLMENLPQPEIVVAENDQDISHMLQNSELVTVNGNGEDQLFVVA